MIESWDREDILYPECTSSNICIIQCNYKHEDVCIQCKMYIFTVVHNRWLSVSILSIMVDKFMLWLTRWWKFIFRIFQQTLQVDRSNSENIHVCWRWWYPTYFNLLFLPFLFIIGYRNVCTPISLPFCLPAYLSAYKCCVICWQSSNVLRSDLYHILV